MLRRSLALVQSRALPLYGAQRQFSTTSPSLRTESRKDEADEEIDEGPIPYSTSPAAGWKAEDTFFPKSDDPPIQGPMLALSISVFLAYFCIIREENDIDENLYKPLNETIPNIPSAGGR